jgi:dienelactone hydrolase
MHPSRPLRLAARSLVAFAFALASAARADSLASIPPLGPGAYPIGCTSVEQDFSRTGGLDPELWWEGVPTSGGTPRYITDLLSTAATPVLDVAIPGDAELFGSRRNSTLAVALIVCYPTDPGNPYADYAMPSGQPIPRMQRGGQPPLVSLARERWPVLLFSNGFGGSPISDDYIEAVKILASHGWVVAAPFHGDSRIVKVRLEDEDDVLQAILNFGDYIAMQAVRPLELAATVDWLLAEPTLKDRIDPDAIGGFGASLGAQSLILLAGARLTHSLDLSSKPVIADGRLKAIAGYVPYFGQTFFPSFGEDQGGIEDMLPVPLLSIAGTADTTAPAVVVEDGMRRIPQSRTYVTLEGVEHGFDAPSGGDIFTWTLVFLAAHANGDRDARATLQRMRRVEGGGDDRLVIDYVAPAPAAGDERVVVEYYNASLDHYFYTGEANEQAILDAGVAIPGWTRTGFDFKGRDRASADGIATCRYFYADAANGASTHFYSILPNECAILAATPKWTFEADAFRAGAPVGDDCPAGTMRVARLYNQAMGGAPNHRFLTSASAMAATVDDGWLVEGSVFCTEP